jgi:hypothetical protein
MPLQHVRPGRTKHQNGGKLGEADKEFAWAVTTLRRKAGGETTAPTGHGADFSMADG